MWAALVTALAAVLVFVVTQSFLKLVLEPIQEQRKLIGEVVFALTVYEKAYTLRVESASMGDIPYGATPEEAKEAEKALRELAGRLRASLWSFPTFRLYEMFARFHLMIKLEDVVVATDELRMWYSQLPRPVNHDQADRIEECRATISKRLGIEQRLQVISAPFIPSEGEVYPSRVERKD